MFQWDSSNSPKLKFRTVTVWKEQCPSSWTKWMPTPSFWFWFLTSEVKESFKAQSVVTTACFFISLSPALSMCLVGGAEAMGMHKSFWRHEGIFSDSPWENLVELQEVKLTEVWATPWSFNSQTCPHWTSSALSFTVQVSLPWYCFPWRLLLWSVVILCICLSASQSFGAVVCCVILILWWI